MEAKHTPTPWVAERVDPQKWRINAPNGDETLRAVGWAGLADVFGRDDQPHLGAEVAAANAAFIVRACNSHAALVEALKELMSDMKDIRGVDPEEYKPDAFARARAALALALAGETP